MAQPQIGGSFAPPLSDEKLAVYAAMAQRKGGPVGEAMLALKKCVQMWWDLPEPQQEQGQAHPSGRGTIVGLSPDHSRALYDLIPWGHELDAIQALFDSIDPVGERDLRNAAFHLLWHVRELDRDREPMTNDRL